MVYITVRQSPIYHQMTLEEYLFQNYQTPPVVNANIANTRTYEVENVSEHFSSKIGVEALIGKLVRFNNDAEHLIENAICDYEENRSFDRFLACSVNKTMADAIGIRLEIVTEMAYHVLHAFKPDWTEHNAD